MKKKLLNLLVTLLCMTVICISCNNDNKLILIETFDKNTRGWIEETSKQHKLYIDSGKYYIESLDTSKSMFRTSSGSLDKSYLFALPDNYEIEAKFSLVNNDLDDVYYGLLLDGAKYEYSFNFYKSGIVEVLEYDYHSKIQYILFSDTSDYEIENNLEVRISVDNSDFKLFIEDYEVGKSKFSVKSWQDLRLFTSKQSKMAVDYITIKEVEQ